MDYEICTLSVRRAGCGKMRVAFDDAHHVPSKASFYIRHRRVVAIWHSASGQNSACYPEGHHDHQYFAEDLQPCCSILCISSPVLHMRTVLMGGEPCSVHHHGVGTPLSGVLGAD